MKIKVCGICVSQRLTHFNSLLKVNRLFSNDLKCTIAAPPCSPLTTDVFTEFRSIWPIGSLCGSAAPLQCGRIILRRRCSLQRGSSWRKRTLDLGDRFGQTPPCSSPHGHRVTLSSYASVRVSEFFALSTAKHPQCPPVIAVKRRCW